MTKTNGNTRKPHPCFYCYQVLYSKGAHTRHLNAEHSKELKLEEEWSKEMDKHLEKVNEPA